MIITVNGTEIVSAVTIQPSNREVEQQQNIPGSIIVPNFNFVEDKSFYEYIDGNIQLKSNWEELKAAQIEANKPTLEELKTQKIQALQKAFDDDFNRYLSQYPKAEVESFSSKAEEAKAYMLDNTVATPYISAMVGGDETLRVAMINSVWNKVQYRARAEGQMIDKRDMIKNCTTVEELDAIEI